MRPSKIRKNVEEVLCDSPLLPALRTAIFKNLLKTYRKNYKEKHGKAPSVEQEGLLLEQASDRIQREAEKSIQRLAVKIAPGTDSFFFVKKLSFVSVFFVPILYACGSYLSHSVASVAQGKTALLTPVDLGTSLTACLFVCIILAVAAFKE